MVSLVSFGLMVRQSVMAPGAYGKEGCSLHGSQEAETDRERGQG
jgi:hypothetical protein